MKKKKKDTPKVKEVDKKFNKFRTPKKTKQDYKQAKFKAAFASDEEAKPKRMGKKVHGKVNDKSKFKKKTYKSSSKSSFTPPKKNTTPDLLPLEDEMRLNKYLAHAGVCSRRKATEYIEKGDVMVNDVVVLEMGYKVLQDDVVKYLGKVITPVREAIYILLNKPRNVITTLQDEKGRRSVSEFIAEKTKERVYPVGRLDRNTTGLLVLTNDGDLAQKLSHPSYEVRKVYKATLDKKISEAEIEQIRNTLELEDGPAPVDDVAYVSDNKKVVGIELHIGRNRIVRRIFEHLGYEVVKLDRVMYSSLTKKNLPVGHSRFLTRHEVVLLKHLV